MILEAKFDLFGNEIIDDFRGKYFFLSNFYVRPMEMDGVQFHSSEQAYMWHKTVIPAEKAALLACPTPRDVKIRGGSPELTTLQPGWDSLRVPTMLSVLRAKYEQNADLKERLIATWESLLIEGNNWCDNFWGDCWCPKCKRKPGMNHLGKLHEFLRQEYRG